jgi:transglutaminase-like putative cysteine protease
MRYDVSLTIEYRYDQATDHSRSILHLLPLNLPGRQEVIASLLTVDPAPDERHDAPDFFGNRTTWLSYHAPIEQLDVTLKSQLFRNGSSQLMDLSRDLCHIRRELSDFRGIGPESPHHFLGSSARVKPLPATTRFAEEHIEPAMSAMETVLAVGRALHDKMEFDDAATDVLTPPEQAFSEGRGVCQDFAHIMIACLRGIGIPAGYVSGFLRTLPPPGQPRLEGSDAMHAWVRAWCGADLGWIEYDPTNDLVVGEDHIVVAHGRDYSDVSPVRGTLRSSGGHETAHFVDVVPAKT